MADHRAEQIAAAVLTKLTGLTTTGSNVFRSRATALAVKQLPGLVIRLVEESVIDSDVLGTVQRTLALDVVGYVSVADESTIETTLNKIRKECTIALQTDVTQGLAFVIDTTEGDPQYDLTAEAERVLGSVPMRWDIVYRSSRSDPSA